MNLDNVTAELRPRTEWEAVDFGARLVRRDAAAIYRIWFAVTLPLLALAMLAIKYTPYPTFAVFLYWWLEPVVDGPILRVIARRLFGEPADVRASLRETIGLALRNKIFLVSPYRFHFARSTAMPVTQLEGLSGESRRARAKILNQKILNHGMGVTAAYEHLVLCIYVGIVLIGFAFVPAEYQGSIGDDWMSLFWGDSGSTAALVTLAAFYIAQTALQPWFIGAGFGLYINCRTRLEAWDIEVAFRRMVQRRGLAVAFPAMLALIVLPLLLSAPVVHAQETEPTDAGTARGDPGISGFWEDAEIEPVLRGVMNDDALARTRTVETWRSIENDSDKDQARQDNDLGWWSGSIELFVKLVSVLFEFGLWIGVALLALLIYVNRQHWLPYLQFQPGPGRRATRVELAGGVISAESLPDDVPAEVRRLWRQGDQRGALSLLYRGSVFEAVARYGVRLPGSATEGQCLRAVTAQDEGARADYFRRVVSVWQLCAYADTGPGEAVADALVDEWPRHYGGIA